MAANEYFNSYHGNKKPYGYDTPSEANVPLRPLRTQSPEPSPYDDRSYQYSNAHTPSSYAGGPSPYQDPYNTRPQDPFADHQAIPMNGRKPYTDTNTVVSPVDQERLPHEQDDPFVRDRDPNARRRFDQPRQGWFKGKITWVVYTLSVVQIAVFIGEIVKNAMLTGSPIMTKPYFNIMIGPSPYVTINMGSRYQPCMHSMPEIQNANIPISWPCPNATSNTGSDVSCSLSQLCGFGGFDTPAPNVTPPNQWWRFIVPIFLHAGIIHIAFNLLLQLTLGRDIELLIGSIRFALVYFAAGIWGFVLGGNFAPTGTASVGCSGSLFGILAVVLLDLIYTWRERRKPIVDLLFIILDLAIAFVLGLLPGLVDNFSHFGGFAMGLVLGVCLLRSPARFTNNSDTVAHVVPYSGVSQATHKSNRHDGVVGFVKEPRTFFRNRRPIWWAWWLVRAAALFTVFLGFILLLKNFYEWRTGCSWCKHLTCLPVTVGGTNWCDIGNLQIQTTTTTTPGTSSNPARDLVHRDVFDPQIFTI